MNIAESTPSETDVNVIVADTPDDQNVQISLFLFEKCIKSATLTGL